MKSLFLLAAVSAFLMIAGSANAIIWTDPAGHGMGWYKLPNDFNVKTLAVAPSDQTTNDFLFFNYTTAESLHGNAMTTTATVGATEKLGATAYVWLGGFTPDSYYTLRWTGEAQSATVDGFTVMVRKNAATWKNFTRLQYDSACGYHCNTSTTMTDSTSDGLGVPIYVNGSGVLEYYVWSNISTLALGYRTFFEALNVTNWTSAGFINETKILNPINTTYYTNSLVLNVTNNSLIHSFWVVINNTNKTYKAPYTSPNGTYTFPTNGIFNLTVYANFTDGATIYTDTVFFTIRGFSVLSNYSEPKVLETKSTKYNISVYDYSGISVMVANLYINGTYRGYTSLIHSGNYWNFTYIGIPENLQGNINETNYDATWEIQINGSSSSATTANTSTAQFVSRLRIIRCAAPMLNSTLFFNITDEDDTTKKITSVFDMTAYIYVDSGYRNYSFNGTGKADYDFCIFPGWTYANMNATVKYHNDSYEDRWWWAETTNLSNTTAVVKLYSINSSSTFITPTFSILNLFQVPQSNVIVKFLRWFVGVNEYRQVATMKTGTEGIGEAPLLPNEQYRYILERGGIVVNMVGPELLPSTTTTKELYTESGSFSKFWKYNGKIGGMCSNVTTLITCNFNDFSGLMVSVKLNGNAFNQLNISSVICANTSTASSGFLFCDITGHENRTISISLVATLDDGITVPLWSGNLEGAPPLLATGSYGLFAAFLIIVAMALIGLSRPELGMAGSLVLVYIGVVVSSMFGLLAINQTILVGLGFGTAVLAYIIARERQ